jgi:hypothetical protein
MTYPTHLMSLATKISEVERLAIALRNGITVDECANGLALAIEVIAELKARVLYLREVAEVEDLPEWVQIELAEIDE